ncbi:MAG: hydroxypyruvate isomerase [Proteobacteria bacterium]|nr:MAG: hydroxypyruvate isomerase [Pseudomonadota bacterium]
MISRDFSASITFMFREHAIPERFAAAKTASFTAVEIQFLAEAALDDLVNARQKADIPVRLLNCSMGDFLAGGLGLSGVPGREEMFRTAFREALVAAERLGATFLHIGPSRVADGVSRDDCLNVYRSNVRWALQQSQDQSVILLVEPINRVETPAALQNDYKEMAKFVSALATPKLRLVLDIYHCVMNGEDPVKLYAASKDIVAHVQFADVPGRHQPGTGAIDFADMFQKLENIGYKGGYGAEYIPQGGTPASLEWLTGLQTRP